MIRVEIDETIRCPIDDVFERLANIERYARWLPASGFYVGSRQTSPGAVGAGTEYEDRILLGSVRGEVSEFERPRKIVFHYTATLLGLKAMEGWPGYALARDGDSATRVCHVAQGRLYGLFRLLQPLVQALARRERRRTVDALKRSLEARR